MPQAKLCPLGPAYTVEEVVNSAHMKDRGFFVEVAHPVAGKFKYPSAPYQLSQTPWRVERPAPLLGQHNEYVLGQLLGLEREELARLEREKVVW